MSRFVAVVAFALLGCVVHPAPQGPPPVAGPPGTVAMTTAPGGACGAGQTCNFDCPQGGCQFACAGGATCNVDCRGGSCSLACDGGATYNEDCDGGNCRQQCAGGATCHLDCDGGHCQHLCDTGASCHMDADDGGEDGHDGDTEDRD